VLEEISHRHHCQYHPQFAHVVFVNILPFLAEAFELVKEDVEFLSIVTSSNQMLSQSHITAM
jgi:hypothetical protein